MASAVSDFEAVLYHVQADGTTCENSRLQFSSSTSDKNVYYVYAPEVIELQSDLNVSRSPQDRPHTAILCE